MDIQALLERLAEARPEWATRLQPGDVLARAGASADAVYLLREGEVGLDAAASGDAATVTLTRGAAVGLTAALVQAPHETTWIALTPAETLRVPHDALPDLARSAPELFVMLAAALVRERGGAASEEDPTPAGEQSFDPALLAPSLGTVAEDGADGTGSGSDADPLRPLYTEAVHCPVCETDFEATRIRVRALNAMRRETDLHTIYEGFNPLHYAMDVCPECLYAGGAEDWGDCDAELRDALFRDRDDRAQAVGGMRFLGERDPQTGIAATLLALRCGEIRGITARKRASILHKLAWLAREVGDDEQERQYLTLAREEYDRVYREDTEISEAAAVRVSFLLGELAFRLGDPAEAIRWFERTVRSDAIEKQGDLDRLSHDRWIDARESMRARA